MGPKIAQEARKWVEAGIITEEQYIRIVAMYPKTGGFGYLIPFLASLLIGLGLISWVAANWDVMSDLVRLGIAIMFTAGFYGLADWFGRKGNEPSQIGMLGLGIISFGVGLLVIVQTYHLGEQSAVPFILWSLAGLFVAWWKRSTVLYLLSWAISFSGLIFDQIDWIWLLIQCTIYLIGFLGFIRVSGRHWLLWFWVVGSIAYALRLLDQINAELYWVTLWWIVLYAVSVWLHDRSARIPFRMIGLYAMFVMGLFSAVSGEHLSFWKDFGTQQSIFLVLAAALIAATAWKLRERGEQLGWIDGLILVPWFAWNGFPLWFGSTSDTEWSMMADTLTRFLFILPLLPYAVHALLSMWRGAVENERFVSILGILQFLSVSLALFVAVDWNFNIKFLIFVISGIILFISNSWIRRYRERQSALEAAGSSVHSGGEGNL
jgi:uncharacterized membrane protein